MTQMSMLFDQTPPRKKRGNVPRTSVLAGQEINRDARASVVSMALDLYEMPLTSAELAVNMCDDPPHTDLVLYVRRGLSDALALGLVEHAGQRKCSVSGRTCLTWKVRTR